MKRLRLVSGLIVAVALCLSPLPALPQTHHDSDTQKAEQLEAVGHETKEEGPAAPANESQHRAENREKHEEGCEYRGPTWFAGFYCFFALHDKFWVSFGTLVLALGTGVLGFATVFLWRATQHLVRDAKATGTEQLKISLSAAVAAKESVDAAMKAIELSERTAERQLRAYISVDIKGFSFNRDPNFVLVCGATFALSNDGQTPANEVTTNVDFRIAPWPLKLDLTRPADNPIKLNRTISPGRILDGNVTKNFPPAQQKLAPGEKLYLIGVVIYTDAFGSKRESRFCGYIEESEQIFAPATGIKSIPVSFKWADRHNEST
ncbi:hypothetical protein ACVWZZ_001803 [Bradyrhizobium sp. LM6.10]